MKKKVLSIFLLGVMSFTLIACGTQNSSTSSVSKDISNNTVSENVEDSTEGTTVQIDSSNTLILYFDYSENMGDTSGMDVDAITSASLAGESQNGVDKNNLLVIVDEIQAKTGADVFSVVATEPYDKDYDKMVMPAQDDINSDKHFEFEEDIDLSDYDTIYLGMPVWWSRLPQPMKVFVEEHDFSGKTIIPFGIHRGSRFGQMLSQLEELTDADILEGYTVSATTSNDKVRREVDSWLGQ